MDEHRVKIIPALDDPEVAAAAAKALDRRETADYGCFMALRELLEHDDIPDSDAKVEAQACLDRRVEANEEFCRLLLSRPEGKGETLQGLVARIAQMNYDGEEREDDEDFIMENDDAVTTLSMIIREAREHAGETE